MPWFCNPSWFVVDWFSSTLSLNIPIPIPFLVFFLFSLYRWHFVFIDNLSSDFKTAEPLICGQRAGEGVKSAIKIIAHHSLSPSFSSSKTQKLAQSPCLSLTKSRQPMWLIPRIPTSISRHCAIADIATDQWASVDWGSEPAPPSLNALHMHNAFCLCAPAATHKNSLVPNHGRLSSPCDRAALALLCPPLHLQHSPLTALAAHST